MMSLQTIVINNIVTVVIQNGTWQEGETIPYPNISILNKHLLYQVEIRLKEEYSCLKVKIRTKIQNTLAQISNEYNVIDRHWENADSDGYPIYIDSCINGYEGESWQVHKRIIYDHNQYLQNIVYNGICIDSMKIRIHEIILEKNMHIYILDIKK
jgi:hypothetical protein